MLRLHRCLGIILTLIYLGIFSGFLPWFTEFGYAQRSSGEFSHQVGRGITYVYYLAFFSVFFWVFPAKAMKKLSPRYGQMKSILLTEGVWIVAGYLCLGALCMVLYAFK
jgi:hypothetical protein